MPEDTFYGIAWTFIYFFFFFFFFFFEKIWPADIYLNCSLLTMWMTKYTFHGIAGDIFLFFFLDKIWLDVSYMNRLINPL